MLPTWFWVLLWVVLALVALAVLGWCGLRVWRRFWALTGELGAVTERAGEVADLLAQIEIPDVSPDDDADSDFTAAQRVRAGRPT